MLINKAKLWTKENESHLRINEAGPVIAQRLGPAIILADSFHPRYYGLTDKRTFLQTTTLIWARIIYVERKPIIWCPRPEACEKDHTINIRYIENRILDLQRKDNSIWGEELNRSRTSLQLYRQLFNLNI